MRTFPPNIRRVIEEWKSGDVYLVLLTITHSTLSSPIYLANNNEDVVSQGVTFVGFPFEIVVPQEDDSPPVATLTVQNVDRRIGESILAIRRLEPPRVRIQVVLASDLETPWLDYKGFYMRRITGNSLSIQCQLDGYDFGREPWPSRVATADRFPGIFR